MWGIYKVISFFVWLFRFLFDFLFQKNKSSNFIINKALCINEVSYLQDHRDTSDTDFLLQNEKLSEILQKEDAKFLEYNNNFAVSWHLFSEEMPSEISVMKNYFEEAKFAPNFFYGYYCAEELQPIYLKDHSSSMFVNCNSNDVIKHFAQEVRRTVESYWSIKDEIWSLLCMNINFNPLSLRYEAANEFLYDEGLHSELEGMEVISSEIMEHSFVEREYIRRMQLDDDAGK